MNLPARDYISGRNVSVVERENYILASEDLKAKRLLSTQFKQLNATTNAIAVATKELVELQTQALNESTKQTAILNTQLQITKIKELERNRQNQIKQAAFSLSKRVEEISKVNSVVLKHLYFLDELNQVELVGLTTDVPNEINDKQYVHDVLSELEKLTSENKKLLSEEEMIEVNNYFSNINELDYTNYLKNKLINNLEAVDTQPKESDNILYIWLKKSFAPKFSNNSGLNSILIIIYYLMWIIPFILISTLLVLIVIQFIYNSIKGTISYKKNIAIQNNVKTSKQIELDNINLKISDLENLINLFRNKYQFNQ